MAEIPLGNQPFDIAFHPSEPLLLVALLTGQVTAFSYSHSANNNNDNNDNGGKESELSELESNFTYEERFSVRPTKRSCRGLAMHETSGDVLYSVTKDKSLHAIDVRTGTVLENVASAHELSLLLSFLGSSSLGHIMLARYYCSLVALS